MLVLRYDDTEIVLPLASGVALLFCTHFAKMVTSDDGDE